MKKFNFCLIAAGLLLASGLSVASYASQKAANVVATADVKPAEPADVSPVFSMENGSPVVTFTVIAPSKDAAGAELSETDLMTLTVYRLNQDISGATAQVAATFENIKPGEAVAVTDKDVELGNSYKYNVIATINGESSDSWGGYGSLYVGVRPARPSDFTASSNKGEAPITVSLVTPTTTNNEKPLEYPLTKVLLQRQNATTYGDIEDIKTWDNPSMGETLTYTDNNVEIGTSYRYFATIYCTMGASDRATTGSVLLGEDAPTAPKDVKAELTDNGVVVTWDKVSEKGANDGYVNTANVVYDIYRYYSYDDIVLVQEGLTVTSYTDDIDNINVPTKLAWQVRARNAAGSSSAYEGISNEIICGPAQPLPFNEYFNKDMTSYTAKANNLWDSKAVVGYSSFQVSPYAYINGGYVYGVDNTTETPDGLAYISFDSYTYGTTTFTSGSINIASKRNLVASFYYYGIPESASSLKFNVMNPDDEASVASPTNLSEVKIGETAEAGWNAVVTPIPYVRYRNNLAVQFEASAEQNTKNTPVAIDNVFVREYPGVRNIVAAVAGEYAKLSWVDPTPQAYAVLKEFRVYQLGPKETEYELIGTSTERPTFLATYTENGTYLVKVVTVYDIEGVEYEAEPTEECVVTINGIDTGVDTINADEIVAEEYFNLQGASIAEPAEGQIVIRKVLLTDGSVKVIKTAYKK